MRLIKILALAACLPSLIATTATAQQEARFVATASDVSVDGEVQIDLFLELNEGGVTSTSVQVGHTTDVEFVSGTNPPGLYCIVELPPDNPCLGGAEIIAGGETQSLSPTETLMGSFFNLNGAFQDSPSELFGTAIFQIPGWDPDNPTIVTFTPEFGTGQGLNGVGGVPIPTTFSAVVVPEPGAALLAIAALGSLAVIRHGRRDD